MYIDENGEVEFNYTVLEKRGARKLQGFSVSFFYIKAYKENIYKLLCTIHNGRELRVTLPPLCIVLTTQQ